MGTLGISEEHLDGALALVHAIRREIERDGVLTAAERQLEQLALANAREAEAISQASRAARSILTLGRETGKTRRTLREQRRDVNALLAQTESPTPRQTA